jgi:uncharacterized protein (TIGR03086 family)
MDDDVEQMRAAAEGFSSLLGGIGESQFTSGTPCEGWDVHALLNHVIRGTATNAAAMTGEPEPDREADFVGHDPAGAFKGAVSSFVAAASAPGALNALYESRRGKVPGSRMVAIRTIEFAVHGWDLAVATGQQPVVDDDLAARCIALDAEFSGDRPRDADGPYRPAVDVAAGAGAGARLAAYFGRDPEWKPGQ